MQYLAPELAPNALEQDDMEKDLPHCECVVLRSKAYWMKLLGTWWDGRIRISKPPPSASRPQLHPELRAALPAEDRHHAGGKDALLPQITVWLKAPYWRVNSGFGRILPHHAAGFAAARRRKR